MRRQRLDLGKRIGLLLFASVIMVGPGCALRRPPPEIILTEETVQLNGWFETKGEWLLFPMKRISAYDPYPSNENRRCVSVVNGTGAPRSEFAEFNGAAVTIEGVALRYDDLEDGTSVVDRLMSKRYYQDELVLNECVRDLVFLAHNIRAR